MALGIVFVLSGIGDGREFIGGKLKPEARILFIVLTGKSIGIPAVIL